MIRISIINMKGGVGKSTLTVNLAYHFSVIKKWSKRLLLVDLDPQFNASQYVLGVHEYKRKISDRKSPTVWDIFEQATRTPGPRSAGENLRACIVTHQRWANGGRLDLIPSQLELSYTLKNPSQKEHLLANFLEDVADEYDVALIDCAPTESVLTTAAYLSSDFVLIPVKPEFLSTIGLPLIKQSMDEFQRLYRKTLNVSGVCFNNCSEYDPEESKAKSEVRELAEKYSWYIFESEIPFSRSFPKGAREGKPIFWTSYSRSWVASKAMKFAEEFSRRIGL